MERERGRIDHVLCAKKSVRITCCVVDARRYSTVQEHINKSIGRNTSPFALPSSTRREKGGQKGRTLRRNGAIITWPV